MQTYFENLSSKEQVAQHLLLHYDYIFIFLFGMFLITYALTLAKNEYWKKNEQRPIILYIVIAVSIVYVLSDVIENIFIGRVIAGHIDQFKLFGTVEIVKWISAGAALAASASTQKFIIKLNFNVALHIFLAAIIIISTSLILNISNTI